MAIPRRMTPGRHGRLERVHATVEPVSPSNAAASPAPLSASSMTSANAHLGSLFQVTVHTQPQTWVWILCSSHGQPIQLGGFPVDLASDWFPLFGPVQTGGGDRI